MKIRQQRLARSGALAIVLACLTDGLCAQQQPTVQNQPLTEREQQLIDRIDKLEQRLAVLEGKRSAVDAPALAADDMVGDVKDSASAPGFLAGTTMNAYVDGYYGYNFNSPAGRVNLLRANDVSHNSFTLNQADVVIERSPNAAAGRRLGLRVDLMFGQNTETLQGSPQNEPRPQVYRNIFQAYGSYVARLGSGLEVDFGKFASALGYENNYAKDQINYSRSYYFNFLPFYHMGLRTTYKFSDKLSVQYWLVNGANQAEDFNGFKSNAFLFTVTPKKTVSWNLNYYFGEEGRDLTPALNPGFPLLPTQPGLSTMGLSPRPDGREHIFDTYVNWSVGSKLTLAAEGDYVINRALRNSRPATVTGGVGYIRYQVTPAVFFGGRFEYLSDRGGLFSGATQALKEATATATYQPADGFQIRTEYRRDYSNQPFFLTHLADRLKREQDTATVGLLWWFGGKQGAW